MDVETALSVQRRVGDLLGEKIGGWKCSAPAPGKITVAPIFGGAVHTSSPCFLEAEDPIARIEPEIAFVLGRELGPREEPYTEREVLQSVGETRLVLELIGCRYAQPEAIPYPEMLADGLWNLGLFVGPVIDVDPSRELPEKCAISVEGPAGLLLVREGRHPDGHPLIPFHWLVNFLSARGTALSPGQIVTTGSWAGVLDVPMSTPLQVTFGDLGGFSVLFHRQ